MNMGGHSVSAPTLSRFSTLHLVLPFFILLIICWHILLLHNTGSSNTTSENITNKIAFFPDYVLKDLFLFICVLIPFFTIVFLYPTLLMHPDHFIKANPMVTSKHIVPEWYFLPFYAILRAVPDKNWGIILMFCSIIFIVILPKLDIWSQTQAPQCKTMYSIFFYLFITSFILLGYCGMKPVIEPYIFATQILTAAYFLLFVITFLVIPAIEVFLMKRNNKRIKKK